MNYRCTAEARILPGPAFLTRSHCLLPGARTRSGAADALSQVANPTDIARLVVFDNWIRSHHRQPPEGVTWRVNFDNVFLSRRDAPRGRFWLTAFDHSHCFDLAAELSPRLARIDCVQDTRLYGLFPEFVPLPASH